MANLPCFFRLQWSTPVNNTKHKSIIESDRTPRRWCRWSFQNNVNSGSSSIWHICQFSFSTVCLLLLPLHLLWPSSAALLHTSLQASSDTSLCPYTWKHSHRSLFFKGRLRLQVKDTEVGKYRLMRGHRDNLLVLGRSTVHLETSACRTQIRGCFFTIHSYI